MKKIVFLILMIWSGTAMSQEKLEVDGKVKITNMGASNSDSIVVWGADGTLSMRLASSLSEKQILSISNDTIYLSDGDFVKLPADSDRDSTNEKISSLVIIGDTLVIIEGNMTMKVAVDTSNTNEIQILTLDELPVPDTLQPVPIRYHGSIIYVHPTDNATDINWATAQTTCSNLDAFGSTEWYLPPRLELDAMYKQSYLITGLSQTNSAKYWSDTEMDANNAYTQRLDYGGPDPDLKTETTDHSCRCVRKK